MLTVSEACAEALALIFPVTCAGCDVADTVLCAACRAELSPSVMTQQLVGETQVFSGLRFEGVSARVVRELKEAGRTSLARALAPALHAAITAAADEVGIGSSTGQRLTLVPIPTSRAAYRRRGYRVVDLVARRAGYRVESRLAAARVIADQRGLGVTDRARNLEGSLRARGAVNGCVIVIDDVLTTGATLREAMRALRAAGNNVIGAATILATPRRSKGNP